MDFMCEWQPLMRKIFLAVSDVVAADASLALMLLSVADETDYREAIDLVLDIARKEEKHPGYIATKLEELSSTMGVERSQDRIRELLENLLQHQEESFAWGIVNLLRENLSRKATLTPQLPKILLRTAELLNLNEEEYTVLAVLYLAKENDNFEALLRQAPDSRTNHILAAAAGLQVPEFSQVIGDNSQLRKMGFVETNGRFSSFNDVSLDFRVMLTLGTGCEEHLYYGLYMKERVAHFPVEEFNVASRDRNFILDLLNANKSILIQGKPGVGKSEFAYALGATLGRKVRILSMGGEGNEHFGHRNGSKDRKKTAFLASRFIHPATELLLIDEADLLLQSAAGFFSFFSSGDYDKGEINTLLDGLDVPVIWIANDISRVPDSTLRRFSYIYDFPRPDLHTRARILKERVRGEEIAVPEEYIEKISREYDLTPSAVDRLVSAVSSSLKEDTNVTESCTVALFNNYLLSMSTGPARSDFKPCKALPDTFDRELCNSSLPAPALEELVQRRRDTGKATRLLFSGSPGGGKTQFALYLAEALEMDGMVRKPSDILSMYVGEAEKNIARMFREAEQQGALLIIDEADALLMDRSNLSRSWEMSQAAEWLQGIQNFSGTLIACTNRFESVDPALRRRFHRQVSFEPLRKEQILPAFKRFFPLAKSDDEAMSALYKRSIMVSDFATAAELLEDETRSEIIVNEVLTNAEIRRSERSIGF
jgi:SpoVK/Ycf46/Vps4 family AAA+-type ATPase